MDALSNDNVRAVSGTDGDGAANEEMGFSGLIKVAPFVAPLGWGDIDPLLLFGVLSAGADGWIVASNAGLVDAADGSVVGLVPVFKRVNVWGEEFNEGTTDSIPPPDPLGLPKTEWFIDGWLVSFDPTATFDPETIVVVTPDDLDISPERRMLRNFVFYGNDTNGNKNY